MQNHTLEVLATPARVVELDRLGDEIAELSAHLQAATACLLDLIREFDAREGWNTGFRSCAHWLSWRVGLDMGAAREHVRVARALGTLSRLAQALARGELSYAKVRAVTRVATPETEARLLAVALNGTAEHVERIVRGWRRVDRHAEAREATLRHASRALHVYQEEDGTVIIRGRLEPEVGAVLVQALAAAREALYQRARKQDARHADVPAETPTMPSSRPTRWPCSRRRRCTTASIPAPQASATRSSSRRCPGALGCGRARPVRPRGRCTRSRGNVAAPGVRRDAGGDRQVVRRERPRVGDALGPEPVAAAPGLAERFAGDPATAQHALQEPPGLRPARTEHAPQVAPQGRQAGHHLRAVDDRCGPAASRSASSRVIAFARCSCVVRIYRCFVVARRRAGAAAVDQDLAPAAQAGRERGRRRVEGLRRRVGIVPVSASSVRQSRYIGRYRSDNAPC
jgi:hypothetical protein